MGTEVWAVEVGVWAPGLGGKTGDRRRVCRPSPCPHPGWGPHLDNRGYRRGGPAPGPCIPLRWGPGLATTAFRRRSGLCAPSRLSLSSASSLSETHQLAHQPWPPPPQGLHGCQRDLRPSRGRPAAASELCIQQTPQPLLWAQPGSGLHSPVCMLPLCTATHVSAFRAAFCTALPIGPNFTSSPNSLLTGFAFWAPRRLSQAPDAPGCGLPRACHCSPLPPRCAGRSPPQQRL